jgi:hypothetical protein
MGIREDIASELQATYTGFRKTGREFLQEADFIIALITHDYSKQPTKLGLIAEKECSECKGLGRELAFSCQTCFATGLTSRTLTNDEVNHIAKDYVTGKMVNRFGVDNQGVEIAVLPDGSRIRLKQ